MPDATALLIAIWAFVYILSMLPLPDVLKYILDVVALALILLVVFHGFKLPWRIH